MKVDNHFHQNISFNTSLAAPGAFAHRLQRLQNPKWSVRGPKMADGVYPYVLGRSKQLTLNKFFDPSTPSMRKGHDGEKRGGKKGKD